MLIPSRKILPLTALTRIIVIDPNNETVKECNLPPAHDAHAQQIRGIIGGFFSQAAFAVSRGDVTTVLYVDDEAPYKPEYSYFALLGWGTQVYPGIGVLSGLDQYGKTVSTNLTAVEVCQRIVFCD